MTMSGRTGYGVTAHARKVQTVMREFAHRTLHSGKGGPIVTSKKQAVAIAISVANRGKRHR